MSRNKCFFQIRISHVLRFISICDLFTDSLSYIYIYICMVLRKELQALREHSSHINEESVPVNIRLEINAC
jgi:hypothetical protein